MKHAGPNVVIAILLMFLLVFVIICMCFASRWVKAWALRMSNAKAALRDPESASSSTPPATEAAPTVITEVEVEAGRATV